MVMGHPMDSSWWTLELFSHFSQLSTTGVTKTGIYAIMSVE